MQRATIYQFNRDFAGGGLTTKPLSPSIRKAGSRRMQCSRSAEVMYSNVNSFRPLTGSTKSHRTVSGYLLVRDSLLQLASAYFRLSRYREAIGRYKRFIEQFPDDERLDRAYLNIVDVLRDEGEENESLNWAGKTGQVFRTEPPEAIALFAETRIYIARSDWAAAYAAVEKLKAFSESAALGSRAAQASRRSISFAA